MGINISEMVIQAKKTIQQRLWKKKSWYQLLSSSTSTSSADVPKGHLAVYVGNNEKTEKKRFVVPVSCLNHPLFQGLLSRAEEEFGFNHAMGGLTIPCNADDFVEMVTYHLECRCA